MYVSPFSYVDRFTIQNVSIKSWMGYIVSRGSYAFTIQNVSIKYYPCYVKGNYEINLQYKMFLLNFFPCVTLRALSSIYNTKCFY